MHLNGKVLHSKSGKTSVKVQGFWLVVRKHTS